MKKIVIILISLIVLGGISTGTYFIFRHNHNFVCYVVEPTFESDGYYQYTCDCGNSYTEFYEQKLQHTYDQNYSYDNTNHWFSCLDEGYEDLYIDLSSHEFNSRVVNPTGQTQGYTLYECQVCDYSYKDNYVQARKYTVQWVNHDNTVLEVDNNMSYGSMPSYDSSIPTRPSNSQFTYVFAGWDKEIDIVTKDITYIAVYSEVENKYKVVWQNWDGANLEIDEEVEYGTMPSYDANKPTKPSTSQYYYTFSGWSPVVSIVTGDVVYTAQYTENKMLYEVIWKNSDGTILEIDNVLYGDMPNYNGNTPTIASSDLNDYTFSGWSPVVSSVTGDVVYTAQYTKTIRTYKVIWKNYDGTILETDDSVLYGVIPTYNGNKPTKDSNSQYTYTFSGWSPNVNYVRSDVVYVAQYTYTINKYTITWKNWDGTVLEIDENIEYGTMPSYDGETPTKENNQQYTYTFIGWDKTISKVTGDVVYTAQYKSTVSTYTVIWKNWDGTVLEIDENIEYGTMPSYDGETPTKEKNNKYRFEFIEWTPEVKLIEGNVTYIACFEEILRTEFYITYNLNGGTGSFEVQSKNIGEAVALSLSIPTLSNHRFIGWNNIYEDTIYQAGDYLSLDVDVELWAMWEELCTTCDGDGKIENVTDCSNCVGGYKQTYYYYCYNDGTLDYDEALRYCKICEKKVDSYFMGKLYCDYCRDNTSTKSVCRYCLETAYLRSNSTYCTSCSGTGNITTFSSCTNCVEGVIAEPAPTLINIEYNSIELRELDGYEYSIDRTNWQTSALFEGLHSATQYTLYQRVATSGNVPFGITSQPLVVTTPDATKYIITYELSGGSTTNPTEYTIESEDIVLLAPVKLGYTFIGWIYEGQEEPIKEVVLVSGSIGDRIYTAVWSLNTYTITYDLGGGTIETPNIESYTVLNDDIVLLNPTREHYDFLGWENDGQVITQIDTSLAINYELIAKWEAHKYTLTYKLDGGVATNPTEYTIESEDIVLLAPVKLGYTFIGWIYEGQEEPIKEVVIVSSSIGDRIYTAVWSINTYTITYDLGGGTIETPNIESYTVLNDDIVLLNPTREHYDFLGWEYDGVIYSVIETSSVRDYEMTANWEPREYTITYNLDGGVATNPTTHNVESPEIILSVPIKNGYTFSGWTGSNGEVADHLVKIEKGNTENLTFTANWVINYYNITYELNGGKNALKNPITYTIIDTISLMDASKEGYTFEGWFTEAQFTNEITSLNGNYSDLILYAKFNPITYETTFDINEGFYTYKLTLVGGKGPYDTSSVTYEVKSGENLNSYLLTTSSYGFLGWYYENGTKMSNNDIISRDTTLTAKWSTKYAAFTETLSYSADAWEYNYYFSLPANYDGNISYVATIRQDVSHNSKYASSYAYIIITDLTTNTEVIRLDGDEYSNIVVKRGNLLLTPGHEYKVFLFAMEETVWVPYPDLYYDTATSSCLIELDAPTKIKYNVSVISESPIISQTYDAIIQTPTNIFRPGYNFVGWFTEDGESIDETYIYASNQTFYAKWEVQNFSINYNLNGGENNDNNPFSYIIEDNIVLEEPTKEGYEFLGWYTESSFINKINVIKGTDCKDYDLHACWRANSYTVTLDYNGGQNCPVIDFYSEGEIYKTVILYKDLTLDYFTPTSSDPSYVFAGWYLDEKCTIEFSFDGIVNKDLKVYAKWLLISEKYSPLGSDVQVNINGTARQYIEIISLVNQEITIKSVSEFDLYGEIYDENMNLLLSSDDISNDELDFCFTVSLIAGIKYYIAYKANQNSIVGNSIISIGGTSDKITHITGDITQKIDSINVYFDDAYFLPKPYREGYEFIGWVDENGIAVDLTCWKYASDSTIYAKWALIE